MQELASSKAEACKTSFTLFLALPLKLTSCMLNDPLVYEDQVNTTTCEFFILMMTMILRLFYEYL
jgi:hypothetical protein